MSERRRRSIFDIIDEYFENLEEWAERVAERLIDRPSWNQRTCTIEPLCDVMVTPTEVIVTVDLPYTEENKIRVRPIDSRTIEVSARMRRKIRFDEFGITHCKGEFEKLQCQVRIPVPIYMDKMEVNFKKGILEVHLPRKREYQIPLE